MWALTGYAPDRTLVIKRQFTANGKPAGHSVRWMAGGQMYHVSNGMSIEDVRKTVARYSGGKVVAEQGILG